MRKSLIKSVIFTLFFLSVFYCPVANSTDIPVEEHFYTNDSLIIESCYAGNAQYIVDNKDSAAFFTAWSHQTIADHNIIIIVKTVIIGNNGKSSGKQFLKLENNMVGREGCVKTVLMKNGSKLYMKNEKHLSFERCFSGYVRRLLKKRSLLYSLALQ